jgi:hypothetical protein
LAALLTALRLRPPFVPRVLRLHGSACLLLAANSRAQPSSQIPRESAQGMRVMRALLASCARGFLQLKGLFAWLGFGIAGHRPCALLQRFRRSAIV